MRGIGLHIFIDKNVPALPEPNAAPVEERGIGTHADRKRDEIPMYRTPTGKTYADPTVLLLLKSGNSIPKCKLYAVPTQLILKQRNHICVKDRKDMRHRLDQSNRQPSLTQIFRKLHADEAAADHNNAAARTDEGTNAIRILHTAQRRNTRMIDAGDWRTQRLCPRREQQRIITFRIYAVRRAHLYGTIFRIHTRDFTAYTHIDVIHPTELLRSLEEQVPPFSDDIAHIVRKPTVCKGYILPTLKQNDLRCLIQTPQTRGGRCSAGNTAHNDIFAHNTISFNAIAIFIYYDITIILSIKKRTISLRPQKYYHIYHADQSPKSPILISSTRPCAISKAKPMVGSSSEK